MSGLNGTPGTRLYCKRYRRFESSLLLKVAHMMPHVISALMVTVLQNPHKKIIKAYKLTPLVDMIQMLVRYGLVAELVKRSRLISDRLRVCGFESHPAY